MSDRISKFKKPKIGINIGLIVFAIIIIYVIVNIFHYATSKKVYEYEVVEGSIVTNNVYTGIALRNESVIYADRSGFLNYYQANESKVSVNDMIYSIDSDGLISDAKKGDVEDQTIELNSDSLDGISDSLDDFMSLYSSVNFSECISYKDDLATEVDQAVNNQMLNQISDQVSVAQSNDTFYAGYTDKPGLVVYSVDGYEDKNIDTIDADSFTDSEYEKQHLNTRDQIESGSPVCKIIESEDWCVVIQVSDELAKSLEDQSYIKIRFCQDDFTTNAGFDIYEKSGQKYMALSLKKGMIRYADQRFLELELILSDESGLKIPNSSITEKEFFTIPKDYFMKGGDSSEEGILVKTEDSDDYSFVAPTIYYEDDDYYYIDSEKVEAGSLIKTSDGSENYKVGDDTATLKGVYNINKGYAVFKQINIIYQNDEYAIVEQKTSYGISLYDHIALDADTVSENELIVE